MLQSQTNTRTPNRTKSGFKGRSVLDRKAILVNIPKAPEKVITTPTGIQTDFREDVDAYTEMINEGITQHIIENPQLIQCMYSVYGKGDKEWEDVAKAIKAGDINEVIVQIDDLIIKLGSMRLLAKNIIQIR